LTAVSTTPGNLPPPPSSSPTQLAGQYVYAPAGAGTRTNSLAIVSLVAGIGSFVAHIPVPGFGGGTVALIAVITGYIARNQIRETGESGMGMATAGMIIGIVHIALLVLLVIGLIFAIFILGIVLFGAHR
jgi:hypothetical protein